jgi:hypothetical protein
MYITNKYYTVHTVYNTYDFYLLNLLKTWLIALWSELSRAPPPPPQIIYQPEYISTYFTSYLTISSLCVAGRRLPSLADGA